MIHRTGTIAVALLALLGFCAPPARGSFHEWKISELYSNPGGTVQFIEFLQPSFVVDDERFVGGQTLTDSALGHSFTFSGNLPSTPAANSHFLVATPGMPRYPAFPRRTSCCRRITFSAPPVTR